LLKYTKIDFNLFSHMSASRVHFLQFNNMDPIKGVLPEFPQPLAVKTHFGEDGNVSFLPAHIIIDICALVKDPVLVENSVLYRSRRSRASTHRELARENGFDFAPLDFLDGEEGSDNMEAPIKGDHFDTCYLGKGLEKYPSLLVVSHFKGHVLSGFGGALKNLGMGLASRRGKLNQHESIKHQVEPAKCISCGRCLDSCPVEAIAWNDKGKAEIDTDVCISCSECISVCPQQAINVPVMETATRTLQERIAEYAYAGVGDRQCFYINLVMNIVEGCDCEQREMSPLTEDVGILLSEDPVAIDQASYDMVIEQYPEFKRFNADHQLIHAEKMGMGSRKYDIKLG
jgi:hypothetical protein